MENSTRFTSRLLVVSYSIMAAACAGGGGCDDGEDPCDADAFSCRPATEIDIDPNCSLETELSVELGEGEHGFAALEDGDLPRLHYGNQGGQHIFVALRISGADSAYASFFVDVALYEPWAFEYGAAGSEELEDSGRRAVSIEGANLTDDGSFEQAGIVLQVYGDLDGSELVLEVTDSCGRTARDAVGLGLQSIQAGEGGARAQP